MISAVPIPERRKSDGATKIKTPSNGAFQNVNVDCMLRRGVSESRLTNAQMYTKKISNAVLEIPTKIKNSENLGSYRREAKHFSENTTMHGPKRIWQGKKRSFVFWLFMVCTSVFLLSLQVYYLCSSYFHHPIVSDVAFQMNDTGLDFPVVTICNYNPIKASSFNRSYGNGNFSELLYDYVMDTLVEPPVLFSGADIDELKKGDLALQQYKKQHPHFTFNTFFSDVGFECDDLFKMCSFAGRVFNCCELATSEFTNMGKCFMINTGKNDTMKKQITGGVHAGLQLIMDAQVFEEKKEDEDHRMLPPSFETGFRYYIHDPFTLAYVNSEGVSVSPGMRAYSAIATSEYSLLDKKRCRKEYPPIFPNKSAYNYSAATCNFRYRALRFNESCGCSPNNYDMDNVYPACTPLQTVECISNNMTITESGIPRLSMPKLDECKIECKSMVYESYNSYGHLFSESSLRWLRSKNPTWTSGYVKENFAIINIFYRDMTHTSYSQSPSTSLTELLSNIGGNMGMFLGMSFITIAEFTLFLSKMVWIVISQQRRKYMADKKKKEEEKHKEVEDSLQVIKKIKSNTSLHMINKNPMMDLICSNFSLSVPPVSERVNTRPTAGCDNYAFQEDDKELQQTQ